MTEVLPPPTQPAFKRRERAHWLIWFISTGLFCVMALLTILVYVQLADIDQVLTPDQATTSTYAMVLGASLKPDGTPSDALADRVKTGVDLYKQGKVTKLLMTGDDGKLRSNEVTAMKALAVQEGVPEQDILVDGQGYRTYESCKRAKEEFHIDQAIIISQRFHLPRALYICSSLGVQGQGIMADRQNYQNIVFFTMRDWAASIKAWIDINLIRPQPPV